MVGSCVSKIKYSTYYEAYNAVVSCVRSRGVRFTESESFLEIEHCSLVLTVLYVKNLLQIIEKVVKSTATTLRTNTLCDLHLAEDVVPPAVTAACTARSLAS